jgi:hypothetical protein
MSEKTIKLLRNRTSKNIPVVFSFFAVCSWITNFLSIDFFLMQYGTHVCLSQHCIRKVEVQT